MNAVKYLIVGILFAVALSIVGYFTILTESGPLKKQGVNVVVYFPNTDGLKLGSRVTVQGVPYGYISRIELVQIGEGGEILPKGSSGIGSKVEVTLSLKGPIKIYENYSAIIKNESLLSGRIIALDPGSKFPRDPKSMEMKVVEEEILVLSDYTAESTKKQGSPPLNGKITQDPLISLSELIAENRADIRRTVSNVADVTTKINKGQGTIGRLINETDMHKNVNSTLTDAQIVLRELREGLEDFREQAPVTSFIRAALAAF